MNEPTLDQLQAYRLHTIERVPVAKVAEKFGVTTRSIHYWCKAVADWMRAEQMEQIATLRTVLTDRIDYIYSQAIRSFRLSKRDKVVTTRTNSEKNGEEDKVQRTPQAAGDPTFLRIAKDAVIAYGDLWHANMAASDKGTGVRAAGKTQLQMVESQLAKLNRVHRQLLGHSEVPLNGDGDRA